MADLNPFDELGNIDFTEDGQCICTPHPYGDGPERECPVHGEGSQSGRQP